MATKILNGEKNNNAFKQLMNALCHEFVLRALNINEPFIVTTDTSDYAIGAILS